MTSTWPNIVMKALYMGELMLVALVMVVPVGLGAMRMDAISLLFPPELCSEHVNAPVSSLI